MRLSNPVTLWILYYHKDIFKKMELSQISKAKFQKLP